MLIAIVVLSILLVATNAYWLLTEDEAARIEEARGPS